MIYHAFLRGEDRTEFTIEVEARSRQEAERKVDDLYPEASLLELTDEDERAARADAIYHRAQRDYEDGGYYDW